MEINMRRYSFYLAVAFAAFVIGLIVFEFYPKNSELIPNNEKSNENKVEKEEIKYGCIEKKLEPFWEKLDKQYFLAFKERELKRLEYPIDFQEDWGASKDFNCSHFNGIEKEVDLNGDGEKELFVLGIYSTKNAEHFVFQKINNQYKVILYDLGAFKNDVLKTKTNGYFDIKLITNYGGGETGLSIYQLSGGFYVRKKCYSEYHSVIRNDEKIELEKPMISRVPCD